MVKKIKNTLEKLNGNNKYLNGNDSYNLTDTHFGTLATPSLCQMSS